MFYVKLTKMTACAGGLHRVVTNCLPSVRCIYASNWDGGKEGGGSWGVSCGDAAPALEMQERVFDQVTQLVQGFIRCRFVVRFLLGGMTAAIP